jgi:hypothetical protein
LGDCHQGQHISNLSKPSHAAKNNLKCGNR